ncbi:MAG TPA: PKD domain-containing protein, partial [Cytophagaceae bacterium]
GLMLATKIGNDSLVSDCVRNYYWGIDNDLKSVRDIRFVRNSIKDQEVHNYLNDSAAANPIGVSILQKSYAWKEAPNDKFVIVEYQITNDRTDTLHQLNVGLFADWDIVTANNQYYNRAKFDTTINLGYVYNNDPNSLYAGIALLTEDAPICYSMDHANFVNNINPVDNVNGFSHKEKYQALTGGLAKLEAGFLANVDISQIVGSELKNILPGETRTVAFAILAGDDFYDLKTSTIAAQNKFKSIKQGPTPLVNTIIYCPGDTLDIELAPTNGNNFKFYGDQSLTDLLHTGSSYNLSNFTQTDTIYITNADSLFESNAVVQLIQHSDTPSADFIIAEDTLVLGINSTAYFFNTSQGATSYEWDFGDASTSTLTHPSYKYTEAGNYTVRLIATDIYGCKDTTYKELVVEIVSDLTEAIAEHILTQPNPVTDIMHLSLPSMDEPLTLVIYNYMGQEIITPIQIPERETHFSIDLSSLPQGMYTLKLIGNSGLVSKKIIKH